MTSLRSLALGAFLVATTVTPGALAQPVGRRALPRTVEVDLDDREPDTGPVKAGQMTEEAARAKRLFDAERWGDAAGVLRDVAIGNTGDDTGNRQIAQYHLAICLYRLGFLSASVAILSSIADRPDHIEFNEALLWLTKLATQLPESAGVLDTLGSPRRIHVTDGFYNPQQRDLLWQLAYLMGRYKHRNRNYEEAISLFEKVEGQSRYAIPARIFAGIAYLRVRKPDIARKVFEDAGRAAEESDEWGRLSALAQHGIACSYLASWGADAGRRVPPKARPRIEPDRRDGWRWRSARRHRAHRAPPGGCDALDQWL